MKTLIKKEIRLLLPAWITAMLLAVAPAWLIEPFFPDQYVLVKFPPPLWILPGLLLLGTASFGQEFSAKTFSLFLSQPVVRNRAWRLKTVMLALAFVVPLAAEIISWSLFVHVHPGYSSHFFDAFPGLWLWAMALFTGGLWTTLLLRQEVGAFWITLLVPAAILGGVGILGDCLNLSDKFVEFASDLAVLIYSAAGFFFARRLFLHAQDTQWTGGTFFLWRRRTVEQAGVFAVRPSRNRFLALLWKELQLHEANLFIGAILFVVNLAALGLMPFVSNRNSKMMLEFAWALWLLMPLLFGCAAVAEERRLGILDSHLCVPVSRRMQLLLKFLVALVLSLFLGGVMPLLLAHGEKLNSWIFVIAGTIFFISFYASSFARATVHAIGTSIAISLIIVCYWSDGFNPQLSPPGIQLMKLYLGSLILLLAFARLTIWNFNWLHETQRLWRCNIISFVVAIACTSALTHAIYYRVWELFVPIQPAPGPVQITNSERLPVVSSGHTLYIVTPNGRLWTETVGYDYIDHYDQQWSALSPNRSRVEFIGGSNWVNLAADNFQAIGVQSDGTLWSIQRNWNTWENPSVQTGPFKLAQIGTDTDWSKVAGDRLGFLLLKKDGSLWTWGTHDYDWKHPGTIAKTLELDRVEPPVRIGGNETFTEVLSSRGATFARKTDGTAWHWTGWMDTNYVCTLTRYPNLDNQWPNFAFGPNSLSLLDVKTNGALYVYETSGGKATRIKSENHILQLGQDASWRTAAYGPYFRILAIRDDGTLWQWPDAEQLFYNPRKKPVQLGNRSNWIALGGNWTLGMALGDDGSVWAWDQPSRHIWLAPSRKPVYMGNIFEGVETNSQSGTKTDSP